MAQRGAYDHGMRVVAVADTHLFHDARYAVPDGDVFVHAGDLCRRGDLDELAEAARWSAGLPHRHKLIVAGNHDWAFARPAEAARARALLGGAVYLEDSGVELDGLRCWGSPWQPAFHGWAFNLPRGDALRAVWARIPAGLDLLITHSPPAGIGDHAGWNDAARAGCAELRARLAVVAPRLHLFGHIHQDGGLWRVGATVHANVTSWECTRAPTVIDLEPGSHADRGAAGPTDVRDQPAATSTSRPRACHQPGRDGRRRQLSPTPWTHASASPGATASRVALSSIARSGAPARPRGQLPAPGAWLRGLVVDSATLTVALADPGERRAAVRGSRAVRDAGAGGDRQGGRGTLDGRPVDYYPSGADDD
jgi:predicted phosphohydrolase